MKKVLWTNEKLKEGLERFVKEHGRLPTAHEVDKASFLPSSRMIQKRFGGLPKMRKQFGFSEVHFGKGVFRSGIANASNHRGRNAELELEKKLIKKFGEVFVHTEKMFGSTKTRVDFYVYAPDGNFGVDVFYPEHMRTLQSNVNIKMNKYVGFVEPLYFVVANVEIAQESLNSYCCTKKMNLKQIFTW